MLTYDQILDISLKINRKELFLDESVYQKLNAIKKQLNIQVNEVLKKTVIKKQENAYGQVFKLLNKITEKNYDKLKTELFELMKQIETEDEINKLTSLIFSIASSNLFYSILFSKLYTELIDINKDFYKVFQHKFDEYVEDIHKIKYIDPNMNYDEYCEYVKKVEQVKSSLTFFINLMKTNICSLDNIVNMCLLLQKKIIENPQNEEYLNSIYIIIKECMDYLLFNTEMETIYNNIIMIKGLNITPKMKFKIMDMLDIIHKYKN